MLTEIQEAILDGRDDEVRSSCQEDIYECCNLDFAIIHDVFFAGGQFHVILLVFYLCLLSADIYRRVWYASNVFIPSRDMGSEHGRKSGNFVQAKMMRLLCAE